MAETEALAKISSQLSLGSNSIGFVKTVADTFANGSSLVNVGVQVAKWLSRECIDGREFEYALELCNSEVPKSTPTRAQCKSKVSFVTQV